MRKTLVFAPQLVLAVLVGIAVGLLWLSRDDVRGTGPPPEEAVTATGTVTPDSHAFGDVIVAQVDVVVDSRSVDPGSIRVDTEFEPYEAAGETTVERVDAGDTSRVRFRYPLRCLGEGCDPSGDRGTVEFELGRVLYRFQGAPGDAVESLDWEPFEVTGRVAETAASDIRWRAREAVLVPPSYRVDPVAAAAVLFAAAALLAALAAWIAWRLWRPPPPVETETEALVVVRSALERALDSALLASRNGDAGTRRRALERVSRELAAVGLDDLSADASVLAWSGGGSTEADVDDLAKRSVSALANGGGS